MPLQALEHDGGGIAGLDRFNWETTVISNGGNKSTRWLDRWSASNPGGSMPALGSGYLSKQFNISQVADIKALARFFILQQPSVCSAFAPQVYPYILPRCLLDSYT
jgi:hypothetical protein